MWSGNHSLALVSIIQRFTLFYFEIEVRGFFVVITFPHGLPPGFICWILLCLSNEYLVLRLCRCN